MKGDPAIGTTSCEVGAKPSPADSAALDEKARALVRYILFADEVPLPGVDGDAAFKADFQKANASPLREFDLKTRLFKNRCSYMIQGAVFTAMPREMKLRVYRQLALALGEVQPDKAFAYLPVQEKRTIRAVLRATMKDAPAGWF